MHIIYLSRHNLSLTLSIFIELQGEESSVAFSRFIDVELDSEGVEGSCQLALNMNFEEL